MHRRILTCFSSRKLVPSPKIPLSFFFLLFHSLISWQSSQTFLSHTPNSISDWIQRVWWRVNTEHLVVDLNFNVNSRRISHSEHWQSAPFYVSCNFVIPKFLPFISVWWVVHDCMSLTCHSESSACCCFWVSIFEQHQDVPPAEQWSFHLGAGVCSSKDINNGNKCVGNRVVVNWKEDWV